MAIILGLKSKLSLTILRISLPGIFPVAYVVEALHPW